MNNIVNLLYGGVLSAGLLACSLQEKKQIDCISGIYPHLAFYNDEGECGTGAVVPWNGSLLSVTYGPLNALGSSVKLYEISADI